MTQKELNKKLLNNVEMNFYGSTERIKEVLLMGADVNTVDENGNTALIDACRERHTEIIKLLLEHNACPNIVNSYGTTALMWSCINKNIVAVKLLMEYSADVNTADHNGWTPLHHVAREGSLKMFKILVKTGADINIKDNCGCTALDILRKYWPERYGTWIKQTTVRTRHKKLCAEDSRNSHDIQPDWNI